MRFDKLTVKSQELIHSAHGLAESRRRRVIAQFPPAGRSRINTRPPASSEKQTPTAACYGLFGQKCNILTRNVSEGVRLEGGPAFSLAHASG